MKQIKTVQIIDLPFDMTKEESRACAQTTEKKELSGTKSAESG